MSFVNRDIKMRYINFKYIKLIDWLVVIYICDYGILVVRVDLQYMYYFIENGFFIEELLNFRVEINFNRKMFFEQLKVVDFIVFMLLRC